MVLYSKPYKGVKGEAAQNSHPGHAPVSPFMPFELDNPLHASYNKNIKTKPFLRFHHFTLACVQAYIKEAATGGLHHI